MEEANILKDLSLFLVLIAAAIMIWISLDKNNYDD